MDLGSARSSYRVIHELQEGTRGAHTHVRVYHFRYRGTDRFMELGGGPPGSRAPGDTRSHLKYEYFFADG